jgi:CHAD domain-containing protein
VTPLSLLREHSTALAALLPGLNDGAVEAVHQARVTTRRVRELLPIAAAPGELPGDMPARFRQMGRHLGRVRDADVRGELLRHLESRLPMLAPSLVRMRLEAERVREAQARRLIKQLEDMRVERLVQALHGFAREPRFRARPDRGWERRLAAALAIRGDRCRQAAHHATGVYFPNRAHGVRIALKRFRYVADIAVATGHEVVDKDIRHLKRVQAVLGDLHDRQELIDYCNTFLHGGEDVDTPEIRLLIHTLERDCQDLHTRYREQRPRLARACARARDAVRPSRLRMPVAAAAAVALSTGLYMTSRLLLRAPRAGQSRRISAPASYRVAHDLSSQRDLAAAADCRVVDCSG